MMIAFLLICGKKWNKPIQGRQSEMELNTYFLVVLAMA